MEITATQVKELRERTGSGMMECKKALLETAGDIDAAVELMRKTGLAKADKKAGRIAAEGVIAIEASADGRQASMVEVNCETDFVAKGDDFKAFARKLAQRIMQDDPQDVAALLDVHLHDGNGITVETARRELIAKLGENINIRRFTRLAAPDGGHIGTYLHGTRIGVLIETQGGSEAVAKDIAMHVAASRPLCVGPQEIAAELLEKEKDIFRVQAQASGKPEAIIDKMVEGRVKKFYAEVTLLGQAFVKDQDISVEQLLKQAGASVRRFERMELGEGLEKRSDNFADEVMAQVRGN